jgi:excisionase family DNA binding protein
MLQDPLLVSTTEAARLLGISERTLRELIYTGELARVMVRGRSMVRRSSLEAFVKKSHPTKTAEEKPPDSEDELSLTEWRRRRQ